MNISQKPLRASALALALTSTLAAAEIRVPFSPDRWEASGKVEFFEHKGVSAMRIAPGVERYDLFAPISQPDDETLRAFVTI